MDEEHVPGQSITRLDNATALRAYAHPVRMKLILALRTRGPLTPTQAGRPLPLGDPRGTRPGRARPRRDHRQVLRPSAQAGAAADRGPARHLPAPPISPRAA